MPEGHTIHRAARDHQRILAGRSLRVSSPQGRFAAGADHLDGRACLDVEAYGKHLVYRFDGESYLHVHLGLFGRIKKRKLPAPEPVGAVRVHRHVRLDERHLRQWQGSSGEATVGEAPARS